MTANADPARVVQGAREERRLVTTGACIAAAEVAVHGTAETAVATIDTTNANAPILTMADLPRST